MNERIKELIEQAGGEFWQRIESDGVLNKEAYITFDPPQSLEKFAELIVRECADWLKQPVNQTPSCGTVMNITAERLKEHFGVEE